MTTGTFFPFPFTLSTPPYLPYLQVTIVSWLTQCQHRARLTLLTKGTTDEAGFFAHS